jgi:hypothetical protein
MSNNCHRGELPFPISASPANPLGSVTRNQWQAQWFFMGIDVKSPGPPTAPPTAWTPIAEIAWRQAAAAEPGRMMSTRIVNFESIQDYIEGRLGADDQARVERFLWLHPIYGERVRPLREQAIRTRRLGTFILREAVPRELLDLLKQLPR